MKKRTLSTLFLLLLYQVNFSQNAVEVPEFFHNQFHTYITSNPSSIFDSSKVELGTLYNSFTGAFSKIRNFEAYGIYRPSARNNFIFQLSSDQQGPVFQKNRLYLGYFTRILLTKDFKTQIGIKLGGVNYSFKPSLSGTGGSDFGLDGAVFFSVLHQKWLLGASLFQFPSTELQPINQIFVLNRYYDLHGYYLIKKWNYRIKSGVRTRLSANQNIYQFSSEIDYKSFLVGASISNIGYSISAGYSLESVESKNKTLIQFLYFIPPLNGLKIINQNKFEIVLIFSKK